MEIKHVTAHQTGKSYNFTGEYPHYKGIDGEEFTPGNQIEIQSNILAEKYVTEDIHCCQSSLVDELINREFDGFSIDDIENIYIDFSESTLAECREYIEENGGEMPDQNPWSMNREQLSESLQEAGIEVYESESDDTLRDAVIANIEDGTIGGLEEWRDSANYCASDNPQEYYQWFHVSPWLFKKLREIGEIVIGNDYGQWWGRGCCGQAVLQDGTLQRIARNLLEE